MKKTSFEFVAERQDLGVARAIGHGAARDDALQRLVVELYEEPDPPELGEECRSGQDDFPREF